MGENANAQLRMHFDSRVRLEFRGATIPSDAGLLAVRELDDPLGMTRLAADSLKDSRTGRNVQHHLVPLLRQSVYSRLAGYEDTNDADRLAQDPAMRTMAGWRSALRQHPQYESLLNWDADRSGESGRPHQTEYRMGQPGHDPHILSPGHPGYGQLREPGAWRAGKGRLQRPFPVHVLPPIVPF